MTAALQVRDLRAAVGDHTILKGIDLTIPFGELHAVMGPNGSGKSTLCHVLSGRAGYQVTGEALLAGEDLLTREVDERARMGLIQGFQYPVEVPGVHLDEFLEEAAQEHDIAIDTLRQRMAEASEGFEMAPFLARAVNDELSGGEKKRSEIFQMVVLRPQVSVLDEIDSGLDIDAVRQVAAAVEAMRGPEVGILMITHYSRILGYVVPDRVHVMMDGRLVESGGPELADELEDGGYEGLRTRLGIEAPEEEPGPKKASEFFTETPFDVDG